VTDVGAAVAAARRAQARWASVPLRERAQVLGRVRHHVIAERAALADVLVDELGKLRHEALLLDVAVAALTASHAAQRGPAALATQDLPSLIPALPRRATSSWRPRGVCALLSPWNYPLAIPMATIAAALIGGNAVVWKPSEHAPRAAAALKRVLVAAGVDDDLVAVVAGGADAGRAVVDADVDHVTFVGSSAVAKDVAARAAARLVPAVIEGGGKAAAIVDSSADVDRAAHGIVFGGLTNGGQSCVATEVVYAVDAVFDALFAQVTALAAQRTLARPVLAARHARLVDEVARVGGGDRVVDVTAADTWLVRDECFGPVIPFVRVHSVDDAIARSNAHAQQLSASVFASKDRARAIAAALRAPLVAVNDAMIHYALLDVPFGGVADSGYGRVHGDDGLRALCVQHVVVEPTLPTLRAEPWWHASAGAVDAGLVALDGILAGLERLRP
jgi:acyl-CoA reductase-like NAD-dependent aldehyde dehydrogenase